MTEVSVKPKRTFWHDELKTKRSPAFDVETGIAHELKTLGLVDVLGDVAEEVPDEAEKPVVAHDDEPAAEPAPKRKGKANAVDKDS